MSYMRTNVWESTPGIAMVELTLCETKHGTVTNFLSWKTDAEDLEVHAEKCLQVAREMRRRKGTP